VFRQNGIFADPKEDFGARQVTKNFGNHHCASTAGAFAPKAKSNLLWV
jgi:hypothetical protein